jgi:hypothetical protein
MTKSSDQKKRLMSALKESPSVSQNHSDKGTTNQRSPNDPKDDQDDVFIAGGIGDDGNVSIIKRGE